MSINTSRCGLNKFQLISNVHGGFFLYRAGLVLTTCMLEKVVMVTPSLPRGKIQTAYAPLITDPLQTRKEAQNSCESNVFISQSKHSQQENHPFLEEVQYQSVKIKTLANFPNYSTTNFNLCLFNQHDSFLISSRGKNQVQLLDT